MCGPYPLKSKDSNISIGTDGYMLAGAFSKWESHALTVVLMRIYTSTITASSTSVE